MLIETSKETRMSNLLEKASLVLIPSGYKEDIVYSEIPIDGSADMVFTRSSNGTRVNSAGLVEVTPWNLFTYSEDFANADWIKVGSTISSNVLVAPNGTTTADKLVEDTSNGVHIALQISASRNVNSIYAFSVYAKAGERTKINLFNNGNGVGNANFDLSNGTATLIAGEFATIESVGNGWYRCVVGMQENSTVGNFNYHIRLLDASGSDSYTGNGTSGAYIWGAQVNLGTAKPYFPTTDRLNVPRLTYQNGGGGCPSLLLEKQSTNLVSYSEQFDDSSWSKQDSTITANDTTSPDGTQNADKIQASGSGSISHSVRKQITTTSGTIYAFSIYAKKGTADWIMIRHDNGGSLNYFNLNTGVKGSADASATIESVGNGWYRVTCYHTGTSQNGPEIYIATQDGSNTFTASGQNIYIWGAQYEASSYKTSYIPTTSSSATRVADACFKTGISSLIGQTEGVVFLDFVMIHESINSSEDVYALVLSNGTSNNLIYFNNYNLTFLIGVVNGGSTQFQNGSFSGSDGQRIKVAFAYKANDFALYINGSQIATGSSGSVPTLSQIDLASYYTGAYRDSIKANQLCLFPTRLTNAELASLTTI